MTITPQQLNIGVTHTLEIEVTAYTRQQRKITHLLERFLQDENHIISGDRLKTPSDASKNRKGTTATELYSNPRQKMKIYIIYHFTPPTDHGLDHLDPLGHLQ